jgi:hypothetical protein
MEFNEENYNKVIALLKKDKDNNDTYNLFMELLNAYLKKYTNDSNKINENADIMSEFFFKDTKNMFIIIQMIYVDDDLIKDLGDETDSDFNENEFKEYMVFVDDINYVCESIDTKNLNNKDFFERINNVILFFEKKQQDIRKLNETMQKYGSSLNKLEECLSQLKNQLN